MKEKKLFRKWYKYIVEGKMDSEYVVKIVLYNDKEEVLFLKRTDYVEKHKKEWS